MQPTYSAELQAFATSLQREGVDLYAVGGCVRDALRGTAVHDVDLCSRLQPKAMQAFCAARGVLCQSVNPKLGTVLLTLGDAQFEHTTFRTESYGSGGAHRPEAVVFADSPKEDAFRRDFCCNALYQNLATGEIIDPTGGLADIDDRVLRATTPNPADILQDDGLRVLRLIRFAATLGFSVEPQTEACAKAYAPLLQDIAWERKRGELDRLLLADDVYTGLEMLQSFGVLPYVLPELCAADGMGQRKDHHKYDVLTHMFHACAQTPPVLELRLMALLHDVGKPPCKAAEGNFYAHDIYGARIAREMLTRLRYPSATVDRVCAAIRAHMFDLSDAATIATLRKRFCQWGVSRTQDVIALREADVRGSGYKLQFEATRWREVLAAMQRENVPFCGAGLMVTGQEIQDALHLPPCERVGRIKQQLVLHCAVHPADNVKKTLLLRMHDYQ